MPGAEQTEGQVIRPAEGRPKGVLFLRPGVAAEIDLTTIPTSLVVVTAVDAVIDNQVQRRT